MSEEDIKATEEAIEKAKSSLSEPNKTAEEIQHDTDDFLKASSKVAEMLYNKTYEANKSSDESEQKPTEPDNE